MHRSRNSYSATSSDASLVASSTRTIGWLPGPHDLDIDELNVEHKCIIELLGIDHGEWQKELAEQKKFFDSLGGVVPQELQKQREQLTARFKE